MKLNSELKIDGKKILIIGNRSYRNLGDELILLGTIKLLMKEKKEIYISVFDVQRMKGFLNKFIDISNITFLTEIPKGLNSGLNYLKESNIKERKKYREIDSIIIGGGEILTEENPNSYRYWLVSILPCCFSGAKIYLMGGIQIPQKDINKLLFDFLLRKTEKIYARDNECVIEMKKYGFKNVEFFMDTAYFAYERKALSSGVKGNETKDINKLYSSQISEGQIKYSEGNNKKKGQSKYIVVNLNKNAEMFLDEVIKDIKGYVYKGYEVYFVPVSKGSNDEYGDVIYLKKIRGKIKDIKISILDREDNFEEFLKILKGAEMVFTGRLHLFMIAKFMGLKVKVYPYQKKILKMQEVLKNFSI